ncbi:MAG: hypothetical protein ACEPOW_13310 [Bacteroidales bacterium]
MYRLILVLFFSFNLSVLLAQNDNIDLFPMNDIELQNSQAIFEQNQQIVDELTNNPVNINSQDISRLYDYGFISLQDYKAIKSYIIAYGRIKSIPELYLIKGLNKKTSDRIKNYLDFNAHPQRKYNIKELWKRGRHKLLFRLKPDLKHKENYRSYKKSEAYLGSPLYMGVKYRFNSSKRIAFGFTIEKDAGEILIKQRYLEDKTPPLQLKKGFDLFKGFVQLNGNRIFRQLIIGNYSLNWGVGLHTGKGFASSKSHILTGPLLKGFGLRPESGFYESSTLNGVASSFKWKRFKSHLFYSNNHEDASTYYNKDIRFFNTISKSGYHRKQSEISNKNTLQLNVYGGRLSYETESFIVGNTYSISKTNIHKHYFSDCLNAKHIYFDKIQNYSVDFLFQHNSHNIKGEFTINSIRGCAFFIAHNMIINKHLKIQQSIRRYNENNYSYLGKGPSAFYKASNEVAYSLFMDIQLTDDLNINLLNDFYYTPKPLAEIYDKRYGRESVLRIKYNISRTQSVIASIKYRNQNKKQNTEQFKEYLLAYQAKYSMQVKIQKELTDQWNSQMWINSNYYSINENGLAMGLNLKYTNPTKKFTLNLSHFYFNSSSSSLAIYYYRPGLSQSFNFMSQYGKGYQYNSSIGWKVTKHIKFESLIGACFTESNKYNMTNEVQLQIKLRL